MRFICHLACIGGGRLIRHDKFADKKIVRNGRACKKRAGLQICHGVLVRNTEECRAKGWGQEQSAKRSAVLKIGLWLCRHACGRYAVALIRPRRRSVTFISRRLGWHQGSHHAVGFIRHMSNWRLEERNCSFWRESFTSD